MLIHQVVWTPCPSCGKPVDEFETKCFWCGDAAGADEIRVYILGLGK